MRSFRIQVARLFHPNPVSLTRPAAATRPVLLTSVMHRGMLTGSAISGSAVAVNYISKEIVVNRDKLETLLAHGASRSEACIPLARDALKLSLLPTINQMSV